MIGSFFTSSAMLLIAIVLTYLLLFVFAKEISLWETGIRYTTLIKSIDIDFSQIKDVKRFYTTRSLTLAGGDKEKAAMFCRIRLKDKPSRLLLFGSAINNYKELYSRIHLSLSNMNKIQAGS
ncbi:MAG: hypothetical protein P8075_04705 [Deltaproteobacteria bacterium]